MFEGPGDSDSERGSERRWAKRTREQGRPDGVCGERRRLSLWVTGGVSLVQGKDKTVRFAISTSSVSRQHVTAKATQITRASARTNTTGARPCPSAHHHSFLDPQSRTSISMINSIIRPYYVFAMYNAHARMRSCTGDLQAQTGEFQALSARDGCPADATKHRTASLSPPRVSASNSRVTPCIAG